ncbi:hypothetical protein [Stenotrophomonas maltophilia]|uniref:hypothetical protein n=1 Tax=Stenotrophomonas maltophilia TaxID=40324 RepID=UPI002091DD95|nr:hypothetical protein [Stenotrophomonas maltophilia]MCO5735950.1 hypothetical protein [Stenotrophomonas maltophilia]
MHEADGLYAFSLADLDAKDIYACAHGRERFLRAVRAHTREDADENTSVPITLSFMKALEGYYDGACEWFCRRMRFDTKSITASEFSTVYYADDKDQAALFMSALYNRAKREGLIPA